MRLYVTVNIHWAKSVRIPRFFCSVFSRVRTEVNTDIYKLNPRFQLEYGKMQTRTIYLDISHAVISVLFSFGGRRTLVKYHLYNSLWFSPDRLLPYSINASISFLDNPVSIAISSTAIWLLSRNCRMFLVTTSKSSLKFNKYTKPPCFTR